MEYKVCDHIRTRASLAVLVLDDYTGRVLKDSGILVSVEGAARPVRKSEGYYVFLNLSQRMAALTVKSDRYAPEQRLVDLEALGGRDPVLKIRLKPSRRYPLPQGTTSLLGRAEPGSEVRILCSHTQKHFRLLYDYERDRDQKEIQIFNPEKSDLDGKILSINNKGQELVHVQSTKDRENNVYIMDKALEKDYKKVGTKIVPVFVTKADELGEYFIPLWNLGDEDVGCQCEMWGSSTVTKAITLEIGKMNQLDFIG